MRTGQKLSPTGRVSLIDTRAAAERFEHRGRGAISNQTGRYEKETHHPFDDGWGTIEDPAGRLETELFGETAKTIITYNKSPDISFDRSINPYWGCEHGCIYCFARPSHAWGGLSPGLDFESKIFFKKNAVERLKAELARRSYVPRPIALGVNTDAYQPAERNMDITRALLEVLEAHNHPVCLITKSNLILRDIDILQRMARKNLVRAAISLTTLDRDLARKMEPRAATPVKRLEAIERLAHAGIPVGVMTAPIIPGLNDHEMESLLKAAADHGARTAGYVLLRLPYEIKDLFHEWLVQHVPDRAARVINHIREMRGGKDYDAKWFERRSGSGPVADLIGQRFRRARETYRLNQPLPPLNTELFTPQSAPDPQMSLGF